MKKRQLLISMASSVAYIGIATPVMADPQPVKTYCVDQWKGGSSEHVIGSMSGFAKDFIFTEPNGGTLIEYDDGTAHFSGLVKEVTKTGADIAGGNNRFQIDVHLKGYTTTAPGGDAKKSCKTAPDSGCWFYPTYVSGTLTGQGNYEGAILDLTKRGPAFQIGIGANAKTSKNLGASSWFDYKTLSQPNTGKQIRPKGEGDFNVDLTPCDITPPSLVSCKVYAIHDEGKTDTVLFTIDPENGFSAEVPGGKHYPGHDMEGLALNADGDVYASSGDDAVGHPKGHLYRFDFEPEVTLNSIGDITFTTADGKEISGAEVSALAFDPNGTLWGWAEGYGLLKIEKDTGNAELIRSGLPNCAEGGVEDIVWSNDGQTLYVVKTISPQNDPPYQGEERSTICSLSVDDLVDGESVEVCHINQQIEALEMIIDDVLMFAAHDDLENDLSLRSLDLNNITPEGECNEGARRNITPPEVTIPQPTELQTTLYDIEGIAWCRQ